MPSNTPEGLTPTKALARIAALCDDTARTVGNPGGWLLADKVRAVLAEVTPEPGSTFDRDQARAVLLWAYGGRNVEAIEETLDRLAAAVRPATIDRDQAWAVLEPWMQDATELGVQQTIARLAACVRPAAGVTLTPDEAAIVRWLLMYWGADDEEARKATPPSREAVQALAARLEAAQ